MKDIFRRQITRKSLFWGGMVFLMAIGLFLPMYACSIFETSEDDIVLIQVGGSITTVGDFKKRFETTKIAYPHNLLQDEDVFKKAQVRLLNQIAEEMVILERAGETGIKVSDTELEKAISKIKEDYPKGVFEEMLLENAISYESWKEALKTRLVIQKTITEEVESKIEILPEDISAYYKKRRDDTIDEKTGNRENESEEVIVHELRRKKSEEAYYKWMKKLQEKYTIEINNEAWEKITKI